MLLPPEEANEAEGGQQRSSPKTGRKRARSSQQQAQNAKVERKAAALAWFDNSAALVATLGWTTQSLVYCTVMKYWFPGTLLDASSNVPIASKQKARMKLGKHPQFEAIQSLLQAQGYTGDLKAPLRGTTDSDAEGDEGDSDHTTTRARTEEEAAADEREGLDFLADAVGKVCNDLLVDDLGQKWHAYLDTLYKQRTISAGMAVTFKCALSSFLKAQLSAIDAVAQQREEAAASAHCQLEEALRHEREAAAARAQRQLEEVLRQEREAAAVSTQRQLEEERKAAAASAQRQLEEAVSHEREAAAASAQKAHKEADSVRYAALMTMKQAIAIQQNVKEQQAQLGQQREYLLSQSQTLSDALLACHQAAAVLPARP